MKYRLNLLLVFVLVCYSGFLFAQADGISFRQISPPGGFALKAISSITQDKLGYVWMGTRQGLIRYDSEKTKWFIPSLNDSTSLPSGEVNDVYTDRNNNIWIATNLGLCLFNRQKQGFKRIQYTYEDGAKSESSVLSILELKDNRKIILDSEYLGYLDLYKNQLIRIGANTIKSPCKICSDNSGRIWIGTESGEIYQFFPSRNEVKKIVSGNGVRINTIYAENKQIWVGHKDKGAKIYNFEGELIKQFSFNKKAGKNQESVDVRVITKDTYGRIWFGTYEGLFMYDGKVMTRFNPDYYKGLPYNSIYEIYENRQGAIWIGTWSGGVALMHHSYNNFRTYRHSLFSNSISNNVVSSFLQKSKNQILIGTEEGGLNSFNLSTERFETISLSETNDVMNIKSLCKDKFGGIWVGTFRKGLWYRPAGSTKFELFEQGSEDGSHLSSSSVYSLCAVDSGIWIGTFPNGLNFYSYKSKSIRFCFQDSKKNLRISNRAIQNVFADSKSNLWLGTLNGLFKIHIPSGNIVEIEQNTAFTTNERKTVYYIWEHSSGDIWIGTKNRGILIYHPETLNFREFNADGLLKGKDVYGITEDHNNRIWITSNNGLVIHNPKTSTNRHIVYSDGIQSNLFSPKSVYKDDKKNLYFGGTNGFTRINPDKVKINSKKPFTIINELVTKNSGTIYPTYSKNLAIDKIILAPGESTLRVNFSADNYLMSEKNKYKYRLINYYDDWVETQNEASVFFKSLKAGEYIFEVKACNNDGIWNDSPTQMPILIKNFWYKTTFAYSIYLLLLLCVSYFIGRFYFERIKLKRDVLLEKSERKNEEQIHEMKLKFFTNISHEFRTPLTLISWPLKKLINAGNITEEQREELEVVKRNSNRLLQLINQIVDLRKLEKGKSKLNISKIEVIDFIKKMQQGFLSEVKSKKINFIFESPFSALEIEADKEKLDTLIYNLLSNAYKYVSEKGQIKIVVNKTISNSSTAYENQLSFGEIGNDNFVKILVEDSGSGIDSEDLLHIFNRFEQGKPSGKKELKNIEGSGIGLSLCKEYTLLHHGKIIAQSTVGEGSRFTILLPLKQKAQKILFESHQEIKNLNNSESSAVPLKKEKGLDHLIQILVVEDNPDFRSFVCKFLSQYYQVDDATNGEEALSILKHRNIDLVVSDVMMPKMDGFEFCSIVKTQVETSHIPVILLTALSSSDNLIAGLDKGADAYLTKPFDEDVLVKQIENILHQRRRIRENFSKQFVSQKAVEVGSLDNFFLNRVRSVVEKNISDENFGMEILAEELMISRSQLHRKIKSLSGVTTSDFVNLVRIKKAVELITTENYLFNEVAFKVGFGSQSYFTKCFRKVYNVTPKVYFEKLNH